MPLHLYHIDAFVTACNFFTGNPAAVVPLERWLPDELLQSIAAENNLSETAFFVPTANAAGCHLRWFTPVAEVDLCGHATLAAAHVIMNHLHPQLSQVRFTTQSAGPLTVSREKDLLSLDFPSRPPEPVEDAVLRRAIEEAIKVPVRELHRSRDLLALVDDARTLSRIEPDFQKLAAIEGFALIVTAQGDDRTVDPADFTSRFFAPRLGIPEDPVTGSAHCTLVPFWASRLGRNYLFARQLSKRTGELWCRLDGDRVHIAGRAMTYLQGSLEIPDIH